MFHIVFCTLNKKKESCYHYYCVVSTTILFCILAPYRISDARLAERMLGRTVEHQFETEDGLKNGWKGLVLARAPIMPTWFFITYEKDPVLYMYQLLEDYKEGDLQILSDPGVLLLLCGKSM